ncbi:MAG: hypothetical protein JW388_1256 [Nitrospira sp.]|nr:hypothetical protein [Nitrospira sp.]
MREKLLDEFVHSLAGLHEHHHTARTFEVLHHLLDGMRADDLRAFGFVGEEVVHLLYGAVVGHDGEAVVVHVEDEILAHHGQADECDVAFRFHIKKSTQRYYTSAERLKSFQANCNRASEVSI